MSIFRSALVVVTAVAGLAGCATTDPLEPPAVTLVDLQVQDATLFETTVEASLRVANPNPEPLAISGGSFRLELNGRKVGSGMTPETFEVAPFASHVVAVAFYLNNASALLRLREILEQKTLTYGLSGKLYADTLKGRVRLPIERAGQLDLGEPGQAATLAP